MKINRKRVSTSLVIPMYNEATYMPKLLASIRASTVLPDEIIICDNGSTDDSVAIVRHAMHTLPIRVVHEHNKGIRHAIDRAWREASGDIIFRTDADCVLPPQWMAHALLHFANDPLLMACTGPLKSPDGSRLDIFLTFAWTRYPAIAFTWLQGYPLLIGSNSAFRKTALIAVDGYTTKKHVLEDQLISRKLADAGMKTRWFWDMSMYHSSRRFHGKPHAYIPYVLSLVHPAFYAEK